MKNTFFISILFLSVLTFAKDLFKVISIEDLDLALKTNSKEIYIYDANVESTRSHVGIIPGAKLLDSSSNYDTSAVLPKEKNSKLVFYCANTMCTASHQAAKHALEAGYTNVSVLSDGIYGWKKAGKPLSTLDRLPQNITAESIEPTEANKLVKQKQAIIVDVREDEERHEIISGSQWMPMSKLQDQNAWNDFKKQLPKDKTIIFHCAAGARSKKMAEKLSQDGVKSSYFKGVDQWKSAGLPLIKGPAN